MDDNWQGEEHVIGWDDVRAVACYLNEKLKSRKGGGLAKLIWIKNGNSSF